MTNSGVVIATDTVAASAAAATVDYADLTTSPSLATTKSLTVPQSQTWVLADVFILATADAGTADPVLAYFKDGSFNMAGTPPLSTMLVSNNSRPRPFAGRILAYEPVSQMSIQWTTTTANDATQDSLKWFTNIAISQSIPGPR